MTLHLDDKVTGAVLGAAIGDAVGHPTEFLSAESIRQRSLPTLQKEEVLVCAGR